MSTHGATRPWGAAALAAVVLAAAGSCTASTSPRPAGSSPQMQVSPKVAWTVPGGTVAFSAAIAGTISQDVNWKVLDPDGGSIDAAGRYTAPAGAGSFGIQATSTADTGASATATVNVVAPTSTDLTGIVSSDRITVWNPGLNAVGGIPVRTAVCRTLAPGGGDDTAAIQAALDTCPADQVVQLGPGTFTVSGEGLSITRSGVVLRGSGPGQTVVQKNGANWPVVIIGQRWFKYTVARDFTRDAPQGTNAATLTDATGLKVGEIVHVNQLADESRSDTVPPLRKVYWGPNAPPGSDARRWFCEDNRPVGQVLEIKSINGNTLTFTTPFHADFETALGAHLRRITGEGTGLDAAWNAQVDAVKWSGIEDLTLANGDGGDGGGNVHLFAAAYSWVKNVVSYGSIGHSCNLDGTFRCEVRDSYFHSTRDPNPGGAGYGIGVNQYASDNLYENNVVWNFNKMTLARASGGGNVFGYNYLQDGYGSGYREIVEIGAGPNHYAGTHMELFEGNESFNYDTESYWGNSTYGMVFRNHWTGLRSSAPPLVLLDAWNRRAVGLQVGAWWFTFLGNVLGFPDMPLLSGTDFSGNRFAQTHFIYQSDPGNLNDDSAVPMWKLGYEGTTWPDQADPLVLARTVRHANFDYVTKSATWDPTIVRRDLPPSLYLTAKPAFFGSNPWPWVTPENPDSPLAVLPAKARFDSLH